MHKTTQWAAVTVIIVSALSTPVIGQTPQIRQQFQTLLNKSDGALARKDVKALMADYADNFKGQDIEGNIYNKAVALKNLKQSLSTARTLRSRSQLLEVKLIKGEAILLTKEHTELEIVGRKTGKVHSLMFDGTWRSIWVKKDQTWKVRFQQQLSQTITRDGVSRVVTPKAPKKPQEEYEY